MVVDDDDLDGRRGRTQRCLNRVLARDMLRSSPMR